MHLVRYCEALLCVTTIASNFASSAEPRKPFTVTDGIGLTFFGGPEGGHDLNNAVKFSPDGRYIAVYTSRGRLDLNQVEESLQFYRTEGVREFLKRDTILSRPAPVWKITLRRKRAGPFGMFRAWKWLANSSGVAFLASTENGYSYELVFADIGKKAVETLTPPWQNVGIFDIRDRRNYVYTADEIKPKHSQTEGNGTLITVGTGRDLNGLLFPGIPQFMSHGYLWAVIADRRFEVKNRAVPFDLGLDALALSPDGHSIVTVLPVADRTSWGTLYPLDTMAYARNPRQYVRITLQTGAVDALIDAPTGASLVWWGSTTPSWSSDGRYVLLPNTFLPSTNETASRPCVVVMDLASRTQSCVERLRGRLEKDFRLLDAVRFSADGPLRILLMFYQTSDSSLITVEYAHIADGTWHIVRQFSGSPENTYGDMTVKVNEGFEDPPTLVAADRQKSRVVWDPNPQLRDIDMGSVKLLTWEDTAGRDWMGGLFLPSDYRPGHRYPLVIQGEGFHKSLFQPSGGLTTSHAARALAAAGILVLQVSGDTKYCSTVTPDEGSCAVSGYEIGVQKLVSDGLVDPARIGIIGFSRTCYYAMEMLTTSKMHLRAASITDGFMVTYTQYISGGDQDDESNAMIGSPPFGKGLEAWLKRSPGFNLDKITAPVLVIALDQGPDLLSMWEPYIGLHDLHKPVDLIIYRGESEHVVTNPAERRALQGASVDWFRFWLQDHEDPDPNKKEQYERWRDLRKLQEENEKKSVAPPN